MFCRASLLLISSLFLAACAGHERLQAGVSGIDELLQVLGKPAQEWLAADGSRQLAFTHGPMGAATEMAYVDSKGRLSRLERNVLTSKNFAEIKPGTTQEQVLRLIGPSEGRWTAYFKARDELVWEWRYCDDWNHLARFDVLFDASSRLVRSTMSADEKLLGNCGGADTGSCWCAH